MSDKKVIIFRFDDNRFPLEPCSGAGAFGELQNQLIASVSASVENMMDAAAVEACLAAAREAGVTRHIMIDREWMLEAIREKLARDAEGENE